MKRSTLKTGQVKLKFFDNDGSGEKLRSALVPDVKTIFPFTWDNYISCFDLDATTRNYNPYLLLSRKNTILEKGELGKQRS